MTDRELLELAAKVAGHAPANMWNPLTDDGDAFRLAVKLGVYVAHYRDHMDVVVGYCSNLNGKNETVSVSVDDAVDFDPYAATRRAIVRAAAEIGRDMK